jgi:hypothetical protein
MFGKDRVKEIIRNNISANAKEIIAAITEDYKEAHYEDLVI